MKTLLTHRLSQSEIMQLCASTHGAHNNHLKEKLYQLTLDDDRRVATNALWVFTHFAAVDMEWLYAKHDQLIDRCLNEKDATKLRLMLNLLLSQPYTEEDIRTDFIDFCLARITDARAPYAIRAQCIKLAYEQMCHWHELLDELRQTLDLISCEPLSSGLRSAWKQVMKKILSCNAY